MNRVPYLAVLALAGALAGASEARAQRTPYIGFVYPAGGQQGTTCRIRLGGQYLDGVNGAVVSGPGIRARLVEHRRKMNPQDMRLMREQLREVTRGKRGKLGKDALGRLDPATRKMVENIQTRMAEYVPRPACAALADIVILDVTIGPDAEPGRHEIRLTTLRGVTNPMAFYVGQTPEVARKPMRTAAFQVLGKEELALRTRPEDEVEQPVTLPCTVNGQIASGEINWYRFEARKGQRLVFSTKARDLVPYLADAVPGWFQPVLAVYDDEGKELAYDDDFRFKPDPTLYFEVPRDGEYRFSIRDAIYRGREDFVYRITVGEMPFVTSIFPLGGRAGEPVSVAMNGWNLEGAELGRPPRDAKPGTYVLTATTNEGAVSNRVPFVLDTLPECLDKESNDDRAHAQKVKLPIIVNGRVDRPDDWDVFQVRGRAGETVVAEVLARRLDSPVDSVLKLTDASGKVLAFNDDHEDVGSGLNTHHADSYLTAKLPEDGTYYVHLGDVGRHGGQEYAYRLRISRPRPDFELRVAPSTVTLRSKGAARLTVYTLRKDGFAGPIRLDLKDPKTGFLLSRAVVAPGQTLTRVALRTNQVSTKRPVDLVVEGRATIGDREVVHEAVPSEDRMQAFLWRHLVPAEDLKALVYNPSYEPPPKRVPRERKPSEVVKKPPTTTAKSAPKPKFTKRQVAGRLRQLKRLFEDGLITDDFYARKVAECEAAQ